jgi:hypothetical protein
MLLWVRNKPLEDIPPWLHYSDLEDALEFWDSIEDKYAGHPGLCSYFARVLHQPVLVISIFLTKNGYIWDKHMYAGEMYKIKPRILILKSLIKRWNITEDK